MEDTGVTITFLRRYFTYQAGQQINFKQNDFNIVVGNNGAGKSTLIKLLQYQRMKQLIHNGYIKVEGLRDQKVLTNVAEGFRVPKSQFVDSRREVYINKLNQKSHGEAWKTQLEAMKQRVKPNSFVIMDEPETALSVEAQVDLCEWLIREKQKNPELGCLIATHSLIIQELIAKVVIDVPSCQNVPAEEYVGKKKAYIERVKNLWKQT